MQLASHTSPRRHLVPPSWSRCGTRASARRRDPLMLALISLALGLATAACGTRTAGQQPQSTTCPSSSVSNQPTSSVIVQAIQLITGSSGWALTNNALSETNDGGQTWATITPPDVPVSTIRGVFFLDTQHGWAVSALANNPTQLQISTTTDGGSSWTTSPLGNPDPLFIDSAHIPAYVDFVDAQHGWVVALIASGSGVLPRGMLFRTSNGGATWQEVRMPLGGNVEFVNSSVGWLAAGEQGTGLYVTSDGGQTWSPTAVTPPAGYAARQATYTIPDFTVPATLIQVAFDNGTSSAAGFYQTSDSGGTWQLAASIPSGSAQGSAAVTGNGQWIVMATDGNTITRFTNDGANAVSVCSSGLPSSAGYGDPTFTDAGLGWVIGDQQTCAGFKTNCTETVALYGTTNNGTNFAELPVP